MSHASEYNITTLRISRAFITLRCRPDSVISLAWIGDFELRMRAAPADTEKPQLFVVEIFDHEAERLIDSRPCHSLADGAVAFDELLFLAEPVCGAPH